MQAYDTRITRLKVRGSQAAQAAVIRELQQAHWPQVSEEHYVFVRRVSAQGTIGSLPGALLEHTRACIEHSNDADNVMRFTSLEQLLAALLTDLAAGVASQHWYWQRWSSLFAQPRSRAICSLLADHLHLINAVVNRLSQQQALGTIWQALSPDDATQLTRELAWKNGYRMDLAISSGSASHSPSRAEADPLVLPHLPPALVQRWHPALATRQPHDPGFTLAIMLMAQEWVPLMLLQAPHQTLTSLADAVTKALANRSAVPLPEPGMIQLPPAPSASNSPAQTPVQAPGNRTESAADSTTTQGLSDSDPHSLASPGPTAATSSTSHHQLDPQSANHTLTTATATEPQTHDPAPAATEPSSPSHPLQQIQVQASPNPAIEEFHTQQGGVLYLLNFLNREPMQALLADYWQQLPNGWIWLYRVAQLLGLDENDPLAEFLARQMGFESTTQLQTLPPLPRQTAILQLAAAWFGQQDLWQPALLQLPARIRYNPSHVDMYLGLNQVRLELRLAGLDINPGWLPWLGRVVQFHFMEQGG